LLTIASAAVMQTPTPLPAAGALATMAAMMVVVRNQQRKDEIDRSKFYLESARDGFDQAVDMLHDNFIRVRWIAAARMLIYSQQLADNITETEHRTAFKIIRDDLRHRLSDILGYRGTGLRGSAFYGAPDEANIDEAARASTRRSDNDGHSMSDNRDIPESVLFTIHSFAEFPQDYDDPIPNEHFKGRTWRFLPYKFPGLAQYLRHRDHFRSISGNLLNNPQPPDRS
jgi:hypothetical protein